MKCHVNDKGDEPVETSCEDPNDKFCMYEKFGEMISRACMSNKDDRDDPINPGCKESITTTTCYCNTDNCNHACTAKDCKEGSGPADPKTCEADCKAPGEEDPKTTKDSAAATGEDDQKTTEDSAAATGDDDQKTSKDTDVATEEDDQKTTILLHTDTDNAANDGAKTTEKAATAGTQCFAEPNQYVIAFLIFPTLVTFIKNYKI